MNTKYSYALSGLSLILATGAHASGQKPNVIYMMVDNWGYGDVSYTGGDIQTPNIDKVAKEGIFFQNYNVQNQSTPSRAAMHTGRLPIRSGTYKVPIIKGAADGIAPEEVTIAELLSEDGYATAQYGKWHIGSVEGRYPIDQGYDEWYGFLNTSNEGGFEMTRGFNEAVANGDVEQVYIWEGEKGNKARKAKVFDRKAKAMIDDEIIDKTIDFMQRNSKQDKPFYAYVGFAAFHPPMGVINSKFDGRTGKGQYADTQVEVDYQVGRLVEALKESGELENTILIIAGDNASANDIEGRDLPWMGSNGEWRGGLGTAFEGGMRTPAMIHYPAKVKGGVATNEVVADLDWFSTLAHLTGNEDKIPTDRPMDSINQSDFILGKQDKSNRNYVLTYVGTELYSVKWNDYKVHFKMQDAINGTPYSTGFPTVYDLTVDPGETNDLMMDAEQSTAHAWLFEPIGKIIAEKAMSMKVCPNTPTGQAYVPCTADFKQ